MYGAVLWYAVFFLLLFWSLTDPVLIYFHHTEKKCPEYSSMQQTTQAPGITEQRHWDECEPNVC